MRSNVGAGAIEAALGRIFDPCSIGMQNPISILDLGLVREWTIDGDTVSVRLCVTQLPCQMAQHIVDAVETELGSVPGVASVDAWIDYSALWTPAFISERGQRRLARRRARSAQIRRITPQEWRYRAQPGGKASRETAPGERDHGEASGKP
jgi:metal-sulfur cluster biosynthetic enzyme